MKGYRAEYNPNFTDFQTYLKYQIKDYWTISFLGNISENTYQMIPQKEILNLEL